MASVIKATPSTNTIQQIAFNFEDLTQQASKYLEQTRIQAAQIVVEAQKQADLIKARSQEEGRKSAQLAAEKTLDEKVGQRMTTLLPALSKLVADLQDAKQAWLRQWEESGVRLAARMAEKILRRELSQDPTASVTLIREALELASGTTHARVLLNPRIMRLSANKPNGLPTNLAELAKSSSSPMRRFPPAVAVSSRNKVRSINELKCSWNGSLANLSAVTRINIGR